jgi:hypothetical protein
MEDLELVDNQAQLQAMSTDQVALAWYLAGVELERRGIDPDSLEFVEVEIH